MPDVRRYGEPCVSISAPGLVLLFSFLTLIFSAPALSIALDSKQQIHCLVLVEGNPGYEEQVRAVFEDANRFLKHEGTDIQLVPCPSVKRIEFKSELAGKMLDEVRRVAVTSPENWDLAIAFTNGPLQGASGRNWAGVIEKRAGRHIIVKCLNRNTLLHEIGHALGLSHGTGMMLPTLKTGYVHLGDDYRNAAKTAMAAWPGKAVSYRRSPPDLPRKISPSTTLAQVRD